MTTEDNKKTARRIVLELFNARNLELIDVLFAPDYIDHALPPSVPSGREGLRTMLAVLRQGFPDLEYMIEDQLAEGDGVAQRLKGRGTLKGEFMGLQPTGKTAEWSEMHFHRFNAGGKVVEHWDLTDEMAMLTQLSPEPKPG